MAATATELFISRDGEIGQDMVERRGYLVENSSSRNEQYNAVLDASPIAVDPTESGLLSIPRQTLRSLRPINDTTWIWEVAYHNARVTQSNTTTGDDALTALGTEFDTTGATEHITHEAFNIDVTVPPGIDPQDYDGAIGYNPKDGSIAGVDIIVPDFKWSETHVKAAALVTFAYVKTLSDLTGGVNDNTFRGFPVGEVKFLGVSGKVRPDTRDVEMRFGFHRRATRTNFTVGSVTIDEKKGWDYLWVVTQDTLDAVSGLIVPTVRQVNISRTRLFEDFSALAI